MAEPNISLLGATYSGVTGVTLPVSGGGTATFPWVEGSETKTQNGTYDVTNLAELVVNVSGGGGSNWTKLASQEFSVNTTSTSATLVGEINFPSGSCDKDSIIWVHVRDKAGKRTGYFYGTDVIFLNFQAANGVSVSTNIKGNITIGVNSSGQYVANNANYGVYGNYIYDTSTQNKVAIYRRYSSTYGTLNGTYKCEVYKLTPPSGMVLFA